MKHERQYAVEVLQRYSHGRYGKDFYFGMYLPGFSKKDAEEVGMETLASMTFAEINSRCVDNVVKPWQIWDEGQCGDDKPIGFDLAEQYFTCRAYIEKSLSGEKER